MRLACLASLLPLIAGCMSLEDYAHPAPPIPKVPEGIEWPDQEVVLPYEAGFLPLPVIEASVDGRTLRALVATRHNQSSIAPSAVPEGAVVAGEASMSGWSGEELEGVTREVVRIERLELEGVVLEGLLMVVEPLPPGIDMALVPSAFPGLIVTLDGSARELRLQPGSLPVPGTQGGKNTVGLGPTFMMGQGSTKVTRFFRSIRAAVATELDGDVIVGQSKSTVVETFLGPELLPMGLGELEALTTGEREVRMDDVFGRDYERAVAQEVEILGSGWLVLGARFLQGKVLQIDPEHEYARLR